MLMRHRWVAALAIALALAVSCRTEHPLETKPDKQHRAIAEEAKPPHVRNCNFAQYNPPRISSDWMWRGGIAKRVEPEYPIEGKRMRLHGRISVRVLIDGNGNVVQACGDGHPILRDAAERAALQWIFRPPKLNDDKIRAIEETLHFNFVLDGGPQATQAE